MQLVVQSYAGYDIHFQKLYFRDSSYHYLWDPTLSSKTFSYAGRKMVSFRISLNLFSFHLNSIGFHEENRYSEQRHLFSISNSGRFLEFEFQITYLKNQYQRGKYIMLKVWVVIKICENRNSNVLELNSLVTLGVNAYARTAAFWWKLHSIVKILIF